MSSSNVNPKGLKASLRVGRFLTCSVAPLFKWLNAVFETPSFRSSSSGGMAIALFTMARKRDDADVVLLAEKRRSVPHDLGRLDVVPSLCVVCRRVCLDSDNRGGRQGAGDDRLACLQLCVDGQDDKAGAISESPSKSQGVGSWRLFRSPTVFGKEASRSPR